MPLGTRDVSGWMLSNDYDNSTGANGLHLGLDRDGRLILQLGNEEPVKGSTTVERWAWNRLGLVKDRDGIRVYLEGSSAPEITVDDASSSITIPSWFFGGRSDNQSNWEGKLDEIAFFERALTAAELRTVVDGHENPADSD